MAYINESFEATWHYCKCRVDTSESNSELIKYSTEMVIAHIEYDMKPLKNPHKIDLQTRRIQYLKMMLLLET